MKTYIGNILTANGKNMLTAVNGGGLGGPDSGPGLVALHTDAASAGAWETYKLILQPGSTIGPGMKFALQTSSGTNYLTAINGGGIGGPDDATCPVHTDATTAGAWEIFTLLVNDSVNPPTVQIMPFTALPLLGGRYLTAVDGGGVGGPNTQPVHTDATSVGTWQQFSFSSSMSTNPPPENISINFNTNINGPATGNIAGSVSLTMAPDGTYSFSGKDNNSNWLPYDMAVALVVVSSKGTALAFTTTGFIDAGLPWDNNNWSWSSTGINNTIQSVWADLQSGYTWYYDISATLDLGAVVNGVMQAAKAAGAVIQTVVAVAGALS